MARQAVCLDEAGRDKQHGTPDGSLVGYNEPPDAPNREGSHNLVIGPGHAYSSYGGIVAGLANAISGPYASVTGGNANVASGAASSVTGGNSNVASGTASSVTGGLSNEATGGISSVTGGLRFRNLQLDHGRQ